MSMAKAIVCGRIGRDLECRYLPNGNAVCDFALAVTDGYGDKKHTSWIECTVFGKQAENLVQYMGKGDMVLVDGVIWQDSWESEGQKRTKLKVKVYSVAYLSQKGDKRDAEGRVEGAEDAFPAKAGTDKGVDENTPF